jgi:hypothetical protein
MPFGNSVLNVLPAKAGIQASAQDWTPAFAGVTSKRTNRYKGQKPSDEFPKGIDVIPEIYSLALFKTLLYDYIIIAIYGSSFNAGN